MSTKPLSGFSTSVSNCPHCNAPTKSSMRFCTTCGKPLYGKTFDRVEPEIAALDLVSELLDNEATLDSVRAAYFQLGLQLLKVERTHDAIDAFEKAISEEGPLPEEGLLLVGVGQSNAQAGSEDLALPAFLRAALIQPQMFMPLLQAAIGVLNEEAAIVQRHWIEQEWLPRVLQTNLSSTEREHVQALVGLVKLIAGDEQAAIEYFSDLPDDDKTPIWQAFDASVNPLNFPSAIASGDGDRAYVLGLVAQSLGQLETAVDWIDRALDAGLTDNLSYPNTRGLAARGRLLEKLGRSEESADCYTTAGKQYLWRKETDKSIEYLEAALAIDGELLPARWRLADALLMASYTAEPPYVDENTIVKGLDVWNSSVEIELPDYDFHWAYLTRALIARQFTYLPGANRWDRYWETITFLEQSLLVEPTRADTWEYLARAHLGVGNFFAALHATDTALLCDAMDSGVIEQRILVLSNLDRFAEVRDLLNERSTLEPDISSWISAIRSYIGLKESFGNEDAEGYRQALEHADSASDKGWDEPWSSVVRAQLLHLNGLTDEATEQYRKISLAVDETDIGSQFSYAWADLMTGNAEAAIEKLSRLVDDRAAGLSDTQRYLGFCYLVQGDTRQARKHLERALEVVDSIVDLDSWLIHDVETFEVQNILGDLPHAKAALEIIDQFRDSAGDLRNSFPSEPSAEQELKQQIEALSEKSEFESWAWLGSNAAIARINLEARNWSEAYRQYRQFEDHIDRFFLAGLGAEQAIVGYKIDKGRLKLRKKDDEIHDEDIEAFIATEASLSNDPDQLESLCHKRIDLERRRVPTRKYGQVGMQRFPGVTPINIEAAPNLDPLLHESETSLDSKFSEYLGNLREFLRHEFGFTTPSVRTRLNHDLPDGTYVIILNEVPLVSGNLDLGKVLVDATVEQLALLNIEADYAVNPVNASECAWIDLDDRDKAEDNGLSIWTPQNYIIFHLRAVVQKNAPELVGLQAVADLLRGADGQYYAAICEAAGGLPRFTSVIHALLAEEVPITELAAICDCYMENLELATHEIAEEIRCLEEIRSKLPGNEPGAQVFLLDERFVALMNEGIKRDGEAAVLALEPEPTQEALTEVRNEVSNMPPTSVTPVILVEDWRIRPFVRKLVELEFPHLMILSEREAIDPKSREVIATIRLES